ncbi:hypothetical protein [Pseudomonas alkylphenolica]|uniref:Uncharacterized protein n=1 Tax=Pseudomonas alkylphenolica TaxID=237609 RepID=A0A077FCI4_9PSED|nr:hypothetical protein [Pseudomonas alkylphenolica]AIL62335.1 hypothetical protein PSAKL28_31670 [Pseudomonas alkylphenolica]
MTRLSVQSGDFLQGEGEYSNGSLTLKTARSPFPGETIPLTRIKDMKNANQETNTSLRGAIGWGMAGALVAGPIGLLAGLRLGGKEEEVTFIATFKDGRKLMTIADSKTYSKMAGTWKRQGLKIQNP